MRSKFWFPVILFAGLMLVNFSVSQVYGQESQDKVAKLQTQKYTCLTHTDVVKAEPGTCPKCGMDLVEKKDIKGKMRQAKDTTMMKQDQMKKMPDTSTVKKDRMMPDTTSIKRDPLK